MIQEKAITKIGTSGFSFPDWRGVIYPENLKKQEELIYYNKNLKFNCLELNATYYTIISEKAAKAMIQKTEDDFEFIVKCFKGITHDPFDPEISKKFNKNLFDEYFEKFKSSIKPFIDNNRLGGVLFQFPIFFKPSEDSKKYLLECKEKLYGIPLIIEFRNYLWAKGEIFEFLRKNNLNYCIVDEPKLKGLMPFVNVVTGEIAYFRLHGRNKNWFQAKDSSSRYDYFYSDEELKEFIPEIKKMQKLAKKTYIFFNNCHAGSAAKNAMKMRELLEKFII